MPSAGRARHVLTSPLSTEDVMSVRCGDRVLLSGVVFSARDAAHKRMVAALECGEPLPFDPAGQVIYYMGPSPAPPRRVIGAAGPTTSARMDVHAPALYEAGIKATIGKGPRSEAVRRAIVEHEALYLAAIGGAGALLSRCIKEAAVIAYAELGPEAVRRLVVENLPVIVVNDAHGDDLYEKARQGQAGARADEE
ncbi:MAG: fumarate hydratase C-terminal domain-containing protein [Candidatus Brocadiae bacterium]|nr:fumarate hydratase C-terminal domain-containing protein [Candidatus Brocadiia bacterium]